MKEMNAQILYNVKMSFNSFVISDLDSFFWSPNLFNHIKPKVKKTMHQQICILFFR